MIGSRRATILFAVAFALTIGLSVVLVGCGSDETEVHHDGSHDPHAGHAHEGADDEVDCDDADSHEGHDHGEEAAEDDHASGPVLSERDRLDAGIALDVARPGRIEIHSRLLGEVRTNAERLAHVVPPVAGTIREVRCRVGDEVTAGQVLAIIASRELAEARAAYLGARGRRELAQIDHDRQKELWERDILAEQDYLDARQSLLEADLELQAAEQTLHALGTTDDELALLEESHEAGAMTRLELRAPISGTITELHMVLGEMVGEDADILVIADLSTVWVELDVPQAELADISVGQEVTITASGMTIADAVGPVNFVSPLVDEETRTVLARIEIPNESGHWRPGLFVTASLTSDVLEFPVVVPKEAVQSIEGEHVVFVPDGNAFAPALVVPGRSNAVNVEIVSGLASGDRYVAEGAFALKAEMVTSGLDSHAGHGH